MGRVCRGVAEGCNEVQDRWSTVGALFEAAGGGGSKTLAVPTWSVGPAVASSSRDRPASRARIGIQIEEPPSKLKFERRQKGSHRASASS